MFPLASPMLALGCLLGRTGPVEASDSFAEAFDAIQRIVAEEVLDPALHGLDWEALGREYRARAELARDLEEFGGIVNELLARLGTSHTHFYTSREPAYYQLLAIFRGSLAEEIRAAHPDNSALLYPGVGMFTTRLDGEVFVSGVLEGWPAASAGLRTGDRILSVEGAPFHPLGSFEGRVGRPTSMEVQRTPGPDGRTTLTVVPERIDPGELFLRALRESARVLERGGKRVAYVHLWSFAGERYSELLHELLADEPLHGADALVLDLRGGWGGANPEDLNLFNERVPVLTHVLRDGTRRDFDPQWRKPVALLIDAGSCSGKEVFAYGFRKHHLGPVVGATSAGAVVGGRPFLVRPGMLLYLAVLDALVDGERLEGRGVVPDVAVPFALPYADGADPQLEAALEAVLATPGSPR